MVFSPFLSFRANKGTDILKIGTSTPPSALSHSSILLFVHGYNNDLNEASESYVAFSKLQNRIGRLSANIVGIYWPGSNWLNFLFYMKAISQAEITGKYLAHQLHSVAKLRGFLKLDIVAHSLGNRLILETLVELNALQKRNRANIVFNKIALMAAAVPVRFLLNGNRLSGVLNTFTGVLNLFSQSDIVLKYSFPVGQTAAGDGFLPIALGQRYWAAATSNVPQMKQQNQKDYGHGDYWDGKNGNDNSAAIHIREFMPHIGSLMLRVQTRVQSAKRSRISRVNHSPRILIRRRVDN